MRRSPPRRRSSSASGGSSTPTAIGRKDGKETFHGDKIETRAGTSYIIYTPSGHMMVHLMNKEGRTKYAGAQPTPDEALKAFRSYNGYFGRFVTYENQNPPFVYHSQQGAMTPGAYSEQKRFYSSPATC